jgi:hypothetical protein
MASRSRPPSTSSKSRRTSRAGGGNSRAEGYCPFSPPTALIGGELLPYLHQDASSPVLALAICSGSPEWFEGRVLNQLGTASREQPLGELRMLGILGAIR